MVQKIHFDAPTDNPSLNAALRYVRLGWPVIACHSIRDGLCTCRDPQCENAGKHPIGPGSKDATLDPEVLRVWWISHPRANPAIVTGDGLVVIDIDNKPAEGKDGLENWRRVVEQNGGAPDTVSAITGSGGRHLFFRVACAVRNYQAGDRLGAGVDVRGHHGYVVAPPSLHRSGGRYAWVEGLGPEEVPVADAPPWLVDLLGGDVRSEPSRRPGPVRAGRPAPSLPVGRLPTRIAPGSRHQWLVRIAGTLRNRGLGDVEIRAVLDAVNHRRCDPPQPIDDVARIAWDANRFTVQADRLPPLDPQLSGEARYAGLISLAATMGRHGHDAAEVVAGVHAVNTARCRPPLSSAELAAVVDVVLARFPGSAP